MDSIPQLSIIHITEFGTKGYTPREEQGRDTGTRPSVHAPPRFRVRDSHDERCFYVGSDIYKRIDVVKLMTALFFGLSGNDFDRAHRADRVAVAARIASLVINHEPVVPFVDGLEGAPLPA